MKLWLSRQHNGLYMLTHFFPAKARIAGTRIEALWVPEGDPVGVTDRCPVGIENLFGAITSQPLESIRVELEGRIIDGN